MGNFLAGIGFLGLIISIVMLLVSFFKKDRAKIKPWAASIFVAFMLFVVGAVISPSSSQEQPAVVDNQTEDISKYQAPPVISGALKVHFIDVGQADCILLQTHDGNSMLIDAGNNADAETVVNYIKKQIIEKLDYVIGTHPHEDHIGGLDTVINTFVVEKIIMPKVSHTTQTFQDVLTAIKNKGLKITTPVPGTEYMLGDTSFTVLAPNSENYENLNDYSVVIRLAHGNNAFLFSGDAEAVSENEMLEKKHVLKSDVLKIGHHGSNTSTTDAFLKAVSPKHAVISVGKNNDYGHPNHDVLTRLTSAGVDIYRTDESGTIIITSDGETIKIDKKASPIKPNAPPAPAQETEQPAPQTAQEVAQPEPVVQPEASSSDITVYITNTGKKYHVGGCSSLSKSKIPISLQDAKARGYGPCGRCHPPQ